MRTNHGILDPTTGYQPKDGMSFESSTNRREVTEAYIKEHVFEMSDIEPMIDALGYEEINENPFLRPRRVKNDVEKMKEITVPIYSTSAFIMSSHGHITVRLYDASISNMNISRLLSSEFPIKVTVSRY